jgi:GntR family transcriptional repressor for pyruvate dehydrogenase complex
VTEPPRIQPVRKAYEQVYDQLRELIVSGQIPRGARLPNEAVLAREFAVSRGTVREALRALAARNLIRTAKGAGGGSFVTLPTVDHVSEFLHANISLLTEAEDVTLEDFLEARELIEPFAARQAAARRTEEDLRRLRATIPGEPGRLAVPEQFAYNKDFHTAVLEAAGNTLLRIAAQPLFLVLQTRLTRRGVDDAFSRRVHDDHGAILAAIEAGDGDAAAAEMRAHMDYLREVYVPMWRGAAAGQ